MDIKAINEISEMITDESMIQFKNGKTIKGAVEVSTIIMNCCENYNKGYLEGRNNNIVAFAGAMILGGIISTSSIIISKKVINKLNSKKQSEK